MGFILTLAGCLASVFFWIGGTGKNAPSIPDGMGIGATGPFSQAFFISQAIAEETAPKSDRTVIIETEAGRHLFTVEIADTPETRARGLMFRRHLGRQNGMLFLFPTEAPVVMWMKNTPLSLDMIFLTGDGRVHHIARYTEPFSERLIPSQGPVKAVLEVLAGTADRLGLKVGDRVRHTRLSSGTK